MKNLEKKINISLNPYYLLLFIYVYSYGLYNFRRIEPIWLNSDGKVFFLITQFTLFSTLFIVLYFQYKISSAELSNKQIEFSLKIYDILTYPLFFCILYISNFRSISNDLEGDETSFAGYSVIHILRLLENIPTNRFDDFRASQILQIFLVFIMFFSFILIKYIKRLEWKKVVILVLVSTIILRIFNEIITKFDNENTEPLLLFYQIGCSIFGFNSESFRLTTLAIFSGFMFIIYLILNRLFQFRFIKSIFSTLLIVSIPLALSASTKIDHGLYVYFSIIIFILLAVSPIQCRSTYLSLFLVLSVYFAVINFTLIASLFFYYILKKKNRVELFKHVLNNRYIYVYLLPQIAMHALRIIKNIHLAPLITGYVYISPLERIHIILDLMTTATNFYILWFTIVGLLMFMLSEFRNKLLIFILLFVTLLVQALFTVSTALGHNRYALQWLYPFYCIFIICIFNIKFLSRKIIYIFMSCLLFFNILSFNTFQIEINKFDQYVKNNKWNFYEDFSRQPSNITWTTIDYGSFLHNYNIRSKANSCVLVGFYFESIPYVLSGSDIGSIKVLNQLILSNTFNEFRRQLFLYKPGDNLTIPKINCLVVSHLYYKNDLVNFLSSTGWTVISKDYSHNGIEIYVLKKIIDS